MPKLKTHSGAKKRFNLTKTGKVKRAHAFKSHILTKKDTKRCRRLRSEAYADVTIDQADSSNGSIVQGIPCILDAGDMAAVSGAEQTPV